MNSIWGLKKLRLHTSVIFLLVCISPGTAHAQNDEFWQQVKENRLNQADIYTAFLLEENFLNTPDQLPIRYLLLQAVFKARPNKTIGTQWLACATAMKDSQKQKMIQDLLHVLFPHDN